MHHVPNGLSPVASVVSVLNSSGLWADGGRTRLRQDCSKTTRERRVPLHPETQAVRVLERHPPSPLITPLLTTRCAQARWYWDSPHGDGNVGEKLPLTATSLLRLIQRLDQVRPTPPSSTRGVGQDGNVGETYRDLITGLTFTILPRAGGTSYPVAANHDLYGPG